MDIIIVLVLVAAVAAAVFRMINLKQLPDTVKDREVTYTLSVYGLDRVYADALSVGDKLYLDGKSLYCGEITGVSASHAYREVPHTDGTVSRHLAPDALDVAVTVLLSADISESGFYIGENTYLSLGQTLDLYTQTFTFSAQITEIRHEA